MVPLLQREALLKYCLEQYRNSNTKYQESVWLILKYWQCNITIALQILRYLYCNIGIAYLLLNWMKLYKRRGQIHNTRKKKNLKKEKKWKIILDHVWGLPSPALVLESSLNAVSLLVPGRTWRGSGGCALTWAGTRRYCMLYSPHWWLYSEMQERWGGFSIEEARRWVGGFR